MDEGVTPVEPPLAEEDTSYLEGDPNKDSTQAEEIEDDTHDEDEEQNDVQEQANETLDINIDDLTFPDDVSDMNSNSNADDDLSVLTEVILEQQESTSQDEIDSLLSGDALANVNYDSEEELTIDLDDLILPGETIDEVKDVEIDNADTNDKLLLAANESPELQNPIVEDKSSPQKSDAQVAASYHAPAFSVGFRKDLQTVLTYMDRLLESLPDEKIEEVAHSEYFNIYKKVFEELGMV
jgi:hypothetical protein